MVAVLRQIAAVHGPPLADAYRTAADVDVTGNYALNPIDPGAHAFPMLPQAAIDNGVTLVGANRKRIYIGGNCSMPRGIQGSGTATMTRPRSGTTINKTMQPWSTVLFQFGNLVGLPANNQYGFDILAYQGNGYVSVLNDPKFCAQVIGWLLQKQGNLKGAIGGNVNAANTGAVGRRNANATGATAGTATHATTPIRRAVATGRSRTTVRRSQTPALATSGANVNSSSGA